ncbi:ferrous iron transport protein B [Bifidobacterium adolescentis]|jgi:ferrous iron transport protein B|uniref:ferrous iron transport protein B n=2 Tax=Bifidobacterium adolescentis TaxID=1680 RepID=UPI000E549A70|nr:ferrous iron transport protein B [Bifidobacterium adolescentis]RGQ32147.1 ferrous iron transport protein B [Bifidobacterium adolescentis]RGX59495.1 ferrous iron transport protein B [Bifidobacterium adolescentis]RGX60492.1 ferrous iron transport protein B [Bifidobacterium adolescentis]RHJ08758.1 ferrous iron transport protein B [Bifidobacterium adolescentis]
MGGDSGNMGNVENVKRVVFVGNPNVGKSSMFNALLGARTRTMNAPGTTVSITCGQYHYEKPKTAGNAQNWQFVDTPGTYSLAPMSPDEQVAVNALTGMSGMPVPDLAVVVLDATALSRSLYLLSMVVELGLPTVVALTMNDLAVRNGCGVDAERLSHLLDGMPVVAIDGRTGNGGKALADAIAASFEGTPVPHGLTALPTATADADMKTADGLSVWAESRADARLDWTAGILRGLDMHAVDHVTLSDRIDRVLLHPVIGVLVFLAVLFVVFQATTTLASPMQDWIDVTFRGWCADGLDLLLGLFGPSVSGGWLRSLLVDGLLDGVVTVLTFIPVMGIMFLLLSILEDSGYMARAAFVMDRAMRALGLDGRAFLPIIVGFGCNLPALAATRTLSDSRQRVLTGMLVPFAACSARLSVFLVLAHAFFPKYAGLVVFLMYVASVMVILLVGVLLRHTMFRGLEPEPLMLALPAYQCPRALQLARSVLLRLWGFIRGASVIIISMITALWLLQGIPVTANAGGFAHVDDVHDSAYGVLADAVAPVFAPAGFDDWHASAALITGFVAKEVVVGSMSQSYHADEPDDAASQQAGEGTLGQKLRASFDQSSHGHGKAAAIAFLLFTLAYTPCLATVAEMRRQFGTKVAARSVLLSLAVAYVIAIIAFQTLRLIW